MQPRRYIGSCLYAARHSPDARSGAPAYHSTHKRRPDRRPVIRRRRSPRPRGDRTMLTQAQLAALLRSLDGKRVLTVYLDGTAADPAVQRSWRVQLEHSLDDLRTWLADSARDDRAEFERCAK